MNHDEMSLLECGVRVADSTLLENQYPLEGLANIEHRAFRARMLAFGMTWVVTKTGAVALMHRGRAKALGLKYVGEP